MKIGLLSAILADQTFEEVIDIASSYGYQSVELACWPKSKASRRYAGVTHIDLDTLSDEKIQYILDYTHKKNIEIAALGYYPNPLDQDDEKRQISFSHIKKLIDAAVKLKVSLVSTFIGKNQYISDQENFILFKKYWPEIIRYAESKQIKIAIENCPMYFTQDEWPGGQNLASSPYIWKIMFEEIPSDYFGLAYDPSHLYLQRMDYLKPLSEFKDKIFHIHFKDIKLDMDKINEYGIFTPPLNYMQPKIPGEGGIDWKIFINKLKETNYQGSTCVEIEDKDYEDSYESILKAVKNSYDHLVKYI